MTRRTEYRQTAERLYEYAKGLPVGTPGRMQLMIGVSHLSSAFEPWRVKLARAVAGLKRRRALKRLWRMERDYFGD